MAIRFTVALLIAAGSTACTTTIVRQGGRGRVPPVPPEPVRSAGTNQPPLVWVGGTLSAVAADHLEIREALGSMVNVKRLAEGATVFYRISRNRWRSLGPSQIVAPGPEACVESLKSGSNLLALRVFLGADCGPA